MSSEGLPSPLRTPSTFSARWRLPLLLGVLVGDGLLAFGLVALGVVPGSPGPWWAVVARALVAPSFAGAVAAEMVALAVLARVRWDARIVALVAGQVAVVLLTPTIPLGLARDGAFAYVGAALLVALFVTTLQYLYRNKQIGATLFRYLVGWTFAATIVAAGWFLWQFADDPRVLAAGIVAELVWLVASGVLFAPDPSETKSPWLLRPGGVFLLLVGIFLTEFFLGALLDLAIAGRSFLQFIPFVPPAGPGIDLAGQLTYNGLWFAAAILASAWFLVAVGFTMAPLVVQKIREAHHRGQKVRLGLTIAVYGLAAIYVPSFASSTPLASVPWLANLPVLGWGFGLRAGGPFESGVFLAVVLMYVAVGVLTVLFGRKAICSVLCGAALMYQGTTISEMRQFNQTSRVGRYFLGSQLSTAYVVASGVALASLFGVSVFSLLRLLPAVQVANGAYDTAALPLPIMLYFGGVWFAMFVTTPFIGTYNCATTGFCHWGSLSVPFAKIGLFRLKVKDRAVCQACTTFDCAKSCPVGLVDMPLAFRTTGEYRSTKCCGVGDCVEACPYGNLYHQDVRFWLQRLVRGRPKPGPTGVPLPMVPATATPRTVPAVGPAPSGGTEPA
jgi:polyferredoxin